MAKFSILSSDIQKIVNFVSNASDRSGNNLFFEIKKDGICSLFGKGNQLSVKFTFEAKVEKEGYFSINSSLFLSAIKEFKNDVLDFALDEDKSINRYFLYIVLKELKIRLSAEIFDKKDVDFLLQSTESESFNITLSDFLKASSKIVHCISNGNERPNLSGIMIHTEDANLNFVATDGRKLGLVKIPFESKIEINESILPKKLFEQIANLNNIIPNESLLNIQKIQNGLIFSAKNLTMKVLFVDGKFPQYKNVIPKDNKVTIDFKSEDLILALRRVSSISSKNDNVYFELKIQGEKLYVSLESDGNLAKDEISISNSEGENFICEKRIPSKSFRDLIDSIHTEYCRFQISKEATPLIISPMNDFFENFFIIAPATH